MHRNPRQHNQRHGTRLSSSSSTAAASSSSLSTQWFQGCPLSKFIALSTFVSHIILEKGGISGGSTDLLSLNLDDITQHGEVYRLFLSVLTFSTTGELITGLFVLVSFLMQFEREMGTKKFASFLLVKCSLLSTILQLLCLFILESRHSSSHKDGSVVYFAPGPYPLIGSLFYLYHCYTPRLHPKFIGLFGFDFSEKFMTYIFTFLAVYSQGALSMIPAICGFIASCISISTKNSYGRWECCLPNFVYGIGMNVGRIFGLDSLVTSTVFMSRGSSMGLAARGRDVGGMGRGNNRRGREPGGGMAPQQPPQFQRMPAPQPPSPEAIEQLTAMGFERDAVVRALGQADNNVEAAANRLLSGM